MMKKSFLERLGIVKKVVISVEQPLNLSQTDGDINNYVGTEMFLTEPPREDKISFIVSPQSAQLELIDKLKEVSTNDSKQDRYMNANAIYKEAGLSEGGAGTIFIIESFADALPGSSSTEDRKNIIQRVLAASGTSLEDLINDGLERMEKLDEFWQNFQKRSNEICENAEQEILNMEEQISGCRHEINLQNRLLNEQNDAIKEEIKKIKRIIEFITQK